MVLIYGVPFLYILAGLIYAPIALFFRTRSFLRFRKEFRAGRVPQFAEPMDERFTLEEAAHSRGSAVNQILGILVSAAVLLSALALLPISISPDTQKYGGLAFLGAFALLLFPGLAAAFDYPAIWDKARVRGENRGLLNRVPTVWSRVILMGATWIVGLVGSYWIAIAWIIAGIK